MLSPQQLRTYQINSKHFRLHTTATSQGLPEPPFCKSFTFFRK